MSLVDHKGRNLKIGKKVSSDFVYTSDKNDEWITDNELKNWLISNIDKHK